MITIRRVDEPKLFITTTEVICDGCGERGIAVFGDDEFSRIAAKHESAKLGFVESLKGRILKDYCAKCKEQPDYE